MSGSSAGAWMSAQGQGIPASWRGARHITTLEIQLRRESGDVNLPHRERLEIGAAYQRRAGPLKRLGSVGWQKRSLR